MIDRRALLLAGAAAVLGACSKSGSGATESSTPSTTSNGAPSTTAPVATTTAVPTRAPGAPASFVARGDASRKQVALTFHTDGDLRIDQRLLDGIGSRAQITCFIVGA